MMHANMRQGVALVCLMLIGSFQLSTADAGTGDNQQPQTPGSSGVPPGTPTTPPPATTTPAVAATTPPTAASSPTTPEPSAASTATAAPVLTTTPAPTAATPIPTTSAPAVTPTSPAPSQPATDAPASASVTPTPTSTSAPVSGITTAPVTKGPASVQPTPTPTSPSAVSGATGTTVDASSTVASGSSSTAAATTTSTAAPKPTTPAPTSAPAYPTKKPEKPFQLDFKIGNPNDSAVYCIGAINCTFSAIVGDVRKAFSSVPGYLYVREGVSKTNRRKRDTQVPVEVLFDPEALTALSEEDRTHEILGALNTLKGSSDLGVDMTKANDTIVGLFVQADVCKTQGACPVGYQCRQALCHHLCESHHSCGEHGVCKAVVNADGTATPTCVCSSDDDHTYSGDQCQNEETSSSNTAAILGGVLGSLCAVFLLIIIFLCCRMRSNSDGGSSGKYQLGGRSNNGYADQEFDMKDRS